MCAGAGEDSWSPWTARRSSQSILKETSPGFHGDDLTGQWLSLSLESYLSPWSLSWRLLGPNTKNWCFWTVVLEKTLESPWSARRSSQSILKETSPGCSLKGLMLRLKLKYFGHLMWRVDSGKDLMLVGIGGRRRRGWQRMRWLDASPTQWTWVWVNSGSWWWTGRPGVLQFMGSQRVRHDWATELNWILMLLCFPTKTHKIHKLWRHRKVVSHLLTA